MYITAHFDFFSDASVKRLQNYRDSESLFLANWVSVYTQWLVQV